MEINFRPDREAHLKKLCAEMGRTVDDFAGEAILTFMEDYEDGRDAEAALAEGGRTYTQEELEREFEVEHRVSKRGSTTTQAA
jgi:predicted DNA-binding protein